MFTKQCKLHTIRQEECRDIHTALAHLASLHADLLLERARLEMALREYRQYLPDATGRLEGHTAGFKVKGIVLLRWVSNEENATLLKILLSNFAGSRCCCNYSQLFDLRFMDGISATRFWDLYSVEVWRTNIYIYIYIISRRIAFRGWTDYDTFDGRVVFGIGFVITN
ncbi:hypothetical protein AaE_010171 [Aphanomyces astaci]|uniref:Uncharacterized protein n=1 Tax=Aphanomyces astaci TaxID=112090 RepID=A0A6A5A5X7_APHAT|nr:hypothetical protein AaE_010171 [Aphanomyces astaci]